MKDISVQDFKNKIGQEIFDKNTDNILEYFSINKDLYKNDNIDLRIEKNKDNSYSIYEIEKEFLITIVKKINKEGYYIIPIGIMRTLCNNILKNYEYSYKKDNISTVYSNLFFSLELEENKKLDIYLFYIAVLIINAYQFDLKKTKIETKDNNYLFINGIKEEIIIEEKFINNFNNINYDFVNYNIELFNSKTSFPIIKNYNNNINDIEFIITLEELIKYNLNEFRTDKE